jgi:hypothetical protein
VSGAPIPAEDESAVSIRLRRKAAGCFDFFVVDLVRPSLKSLTGSEIRGVKNQKTEKLWTEK